MGTFLLIRKQGGNAPDVSPALDVFARQGLASATELEAGDWRLYALPFLSDSGRTQRSTVVADPSGPFTAAFGTLIYRQSAGGEAVRKLHEDFAVDNVRWESFGGCYCVVRGEQEGISLFTDQGGSFKAYASQTRNVISSSLLATAALLKSKTLDTQAAYEYVFQGASYGWRTPIREISQLQGGRRYRFARQDTETPWPIALPGKPLAGSFDDHIERCRSALDPIFDSLVAAFGDKIDTALSGGYDSRLILALLRARGMTPRLHVYGKAGDADVLIAKTIAKAEGLELLHEDKSASAEPTIGELAEIVARNFFVFDGLPNDGILDNGRDFESRQERVGDGYVALNGGGGEIFRNFFYLPDRPMRVRALLWTFYSQYDPTACASAFSEHQYLKNLAAKILAALGRTETAPLDARLTRTEVELVYPLFRGQFWAARNTSTNNRIGPALTPFMEPVLASVSATVPLHWKNDGRLQAALIRSYDRRLAEYDSAYGYGFDRAPPVLARLKSAANRHRPPFLRRYTFRLKRRLGASNNDMTALDHAIHDLLPNGFRRLDRLFTPDRITEPGQANRLVSLEYFLQQTDTNPV